jgi:membrane-bound lytic murein transglycosylase B
LVVILLLMCASAAGAGFLAHGRSRARPPARLTVGAAAVIGTPVAPHAPASAYADRTVPRSWLRMYWRAGAQYGLDWTVLAAVGALESDNGASSLPGVRTGTNDAGMAGPAQFASGTWARYSVNVDPGRAPGPSRYDAADAITTMAAYLKASGAPQNWAGALYAYNHSAAYVRAVLALAARYRGSSRGGRAVASPRRARVGRGTRTPSPTR